MRSEDEDDHSPPAAPPVAADGGDENDETRNILVEMPDSQFKCLSSIKEKYGFTWKGMLFHARRSLIREEECADDREK